MEQSIKRLRRIWEKIKSCCENPSDPTYFSCGALGIKICSEWSSSSDAFIVWALSNGYQDDLSIERIDVSGNYEPSNCRWAPTEIQENRIRRYWRPEDHPELVHDGFPKGITLEELRDSVKVRLLNNTLTQVWLINRLDEEGLNTDKAELSSVLAGTRHGAKAETLLKVADSILSRYENNMSLL